MAWRGWWPGGYRRPEPRTSTSATPSPGTGSAAPTRGSTRPRGRSPTRTTRRRPGTGTGTCRPWYGSPAEPGTGGSGGISWPMVTSRPSPDVVARRLRTAGCVFAEDEARLLIEAARTPADLAAMVHQREAGLPLEHIVGWAEFCGLRIAIDPGVFVPRHRTGLLVREAAARTPVGATVVDLACGSGAVAVALAARVGDLTVYAVDVDPAALACARRNLGPPGGRGDAGDLFAPPPAPPRGQVHALVANRP